MNPVDLKFLRADTLETITLADLGTAYKNTSNTTIPIMIYNAGDRDAINVKALFEPYKRPDGRLDNIACDWQQLGYDSTDNYKTLLDLPNVPAGAYMPGYKESYENFDKIIGKNLPVDWSTFGGTWEVYFLTEGQGLNQYLHHKAISTSITTGLAIPRHFGTTRNSDTSFEIAVPKSNFGGMMLRLDSSNYGYFVIMYPDPFTIGKINQYYSEILGSSYKPISEDYESAIGIGKGFYSDLDNFDNWNIYKRCHWLPKGTGAQGLTRDVLRVNLNENVFNIYINGDWKGKYVDPDPLLRDGYMGLLAGRRYSSVTIFDALVHRIETKRGIIYVKSNVPSNPADSLDGDNVYYSGLAVKYSE